MFKHHTFFLTCAGLVLLCATQLQAQDSLVVFSKGPDGSGNINFRLVEEWMFRAGSDSTWRAEEADQWERLSPFDIDLLEPDENGFTEGWFHLRFMLDSSYAYVPLSWHYVNYAASEIYLDGRLVGRYGVPVKELGRYQGQAYATQLPKAAHLRIGVPHQLSIYVVHYRQPWLRTYTQRPELGMASMQLVDDDVMIRYKSRLYRSIFGTGASFMVSFALSIIAWLLFLQSRRDKTLGIVAALITLIMLSNLNNVWNSGISSLQYLEYAELLYHTTLFAFFALLTIFIRNESQPHRQVRYGWFMGVAVLLGIAEWFNPVMYVFAPFLALCSGLTLFYVIRYWRSMSVTIRPLLVASVLVILLEIQFVVNTLTGWIALPAVVDDVILYMFVMAMPLSMLMYVSLRFRDNLFAVRKHAQEVMRLGEEKLRAEQEKQQLIQQQNQMLEAQVAERTSALEQSIEELRAMQDQLVQQEKLASLGQLTAGIAHEIKNPLNFVTNFSSVSVELLDETTEAIKTKVAGTQPTEAPDPLPWSYILDDLGSVRDNLGKIHEHGTRADRIVKSMLQHSRSSAGDKLPTDLNQLVSEFTNLSFHGMRAGEKRINCEIVFDLDEAVGEVPLVAQDFSRVVLNLTANAFDAMREVVGNQESGNGRPGYAPRLTVRTKRAEGRISVEVTDNGSGIPADIRDKILQPFFTTKKGTEGTGLGLSISHNIVLAHGGQMRIDSTPGVGTTFEVTLPV